jgi:hypothetical protein
MFSVIPSRIPPIATALAFVVLGPLAAFGASRLLFPAVPNPSTGPEPSPRVVREFIVLPPPAPVEKSQVVRAEVEPLPEAPGSGQDAPMRPSSFAPAPWDGERLARTIASASPGPPLPAPRDIVLPPVSPKPAPPPLGSPRVACGTTTCAPGETCCSPACGICDAPGVACTRQDCGSASYPSSPTCGANTCNVGEACCNPSCGICTRPGATCSQTKCDDGPTVPFSPACGMNTCNIGLVCCDANCGLCAPVSECARLHC